MQRSDLQPGFADLAVAHLGGPKAAALFARLEAEVPFGTLADAVADVYDADPHTPAAGRPHWKVLTMVKLLFLQKLFGLSDPGAEEMLQDRLSFRRFLGLSLEDATPDHSTIAKFRKRLVEKGHGSTLFDATLLDLEERGLIVKPGTLIDASIVEAPLGRTRKTDTSAGDAGTSTADPSASKTSKRGRPHHGYRVHFATDRRGVVTDYVYDTARASEHDHFDHLARHEQHAVYADSGCRSRTRVKQLRQRGVKARLCHRRVRGQAELTARQRAMNKLIAPIRALVEHPLAWFKQRLSSGVGGMGRARYQGLARNGFDFALSMMVYNYCRATAERVAT